jgi:hypothetical protein
MGDRTPIWPVVGYVYSLVTTAYLPEFHAYISVVAVATGGGYNGVMGYRWAPKPEGPWSAIATVPAHQWGFASLLPIPALGYNVVSSNPPHVQLPMLSNTDLALHTQNGTPYFSMWDFVVGRNGIVPGSSDSPVYGKFDALRTNSGITISDSHAPGTIPRNGIVAAWDFWDQAGDTTQTGTAYASLWNAGFHDFANGGLFLTPCNIGNVCGTWTTGQGRQLTTYGANFGGAGYNPGMLTMQHWGPTTISNGLAATTTGGMTPANMNAMAGNSSYSVVQVVRVDTVPAPGGVEPMWQVGDWSSSNTAVELYVNNAHTSLLWGTSAGLWWYQSPFVFTASSWNFVTTVVQANGATPKANLWVGVGGKLVDEFAGISRTQAGTATQTPNITAKPFTLRSMQPMATDSLDSSFAGTYIYDRALNRAEVGLMYQTLKANALKRGLTVQ